MCTLNLSRLFLTGSALAELGRCLIYEALRDWLVSSGPMSWRRLLDSHHLQRSFQSLGHLRTVTAL